MTKKEHMEVLRAVFLDCPTVSSDLARRNAVVIAAFASRGYISTASGPGEYSNVWRPTALGLGVLQLEGLVQ